MAAGSGTRPQPCSYTTLTNHPRPPGKLLTSAWMQGRTGQPPDLRLETELALCHRLLVDAIKWQKKWARLPSLPFRCNFPPGLLSQFFRKLWFGEGAGAWQLLCVWRGRGVWNEDTFFLFLFPPLWSKWSFLDWLFQRGRCMPGRRIIDTAAAPLHSTNGGAVSHPDLHTGPPCVLCSTTGAQCAELLCFQDGKLLFLVPFTRHPLHKSWWLTDALEKLFLPLLLMGQFLG